MKKPTTWAILIGAVALGAASSEERASDPFDTSPSSPTATFADAGPITFLSAQQALGISEWTLDQWPTQIIEEFRIFFRPADGTTTRLLRLAVGSDECWIEERETSETWSASWGSVATRIAVKIDVDESVREALELASQAELYQRPSLDESALIDSFTADSIWILDLLSEEHRTSIIIRNVDMLSTLNLPGERQLSRDFGQYEKIWNKLSEIFSAYAESDARAN